MKRSSPEWRAHLKRIASSGGKARAAMPGFAAHNRRISHLGGLATLRKHGIAHLIGIVQAKCLANPSNLERQMMTILDRLGLNYEREHVIVLSDGWLRLVDFYLSDYNLVIEVNGRVHDPDLGFRCPDKAASKYAAIQDEGYQLLVLDHTEMNQAERLLQEALNGRPQQALDY